MTIKNILVAFNASPQAKSALQTALVMAARYEAHITGILSHGLPSLLYSYGGHVPQAAMDQIEDSDSKHRQEVGQEFAKMTESYPADKTHFLDVYGEADEMLMDVALGYDLVVMGGVNKHPDFPHMEVHADTIARSSGKPVLVVPQGYDPDDFNDSVMLAWDGKKAASRAMSEVIKLLEPRSSVSVLCVGSKEAAEVRAIPAMSHLERHGFDVRLVTRKGRKVAKAILAATEEADSGMLVMGAYEHAKFREDLFGGVTNTVLKKTKIPVLLSH